MLTRRDFLKGALAAGALPFAVGSELAAGTEPAGRRWRSITYNVLRCRGYAVAPEAKPFLKAAAGQVPMRLALELALYAPDIVSFQEAPPEPVVKSIAQQLGMNYAFFPGGWPGAVLSKFEIAELQNCPLQSWRERPQALFTRHWGRALVRAPGGDINFLSTLIHKSAHVFFRLRQPIPWF